MAGDLKTILLVIIVASVILMRRHRRQTTRQKHGLAKNQRTVYLFQQWLDPLVEIIIVGGVLFDDLSHGLLPWLALIIGLAIGLPLGAVRGKFMYVRSIDGSKKVVVERNLFEVSILLVLIIIKLIARSISSKPTSAVNLIATGLLAIGLASSVGRVAYITILHRRSTSLKPQEVKSKA